MAKLIRTRQDCHISTGSQGTYEVCETVLLVDWQLLLERYPLSVSSNPKSIKQNVQVAELQYIYPKYDKFKFVFSMMNSSIIDWCAVSSPKLEGNILKLEPGENTDLIYTFKNLSLLELGKTQMTMRIQAYGIKGDQEVKLENELVKGIIEMDKTDNSGSIFSTNKEVYNLNFNLANHQLTGDTEIIIYSKNDVGWVNQPYELTVNKVENTSTTSLFLSNIKPDLLEGNYSELMLLQAEGKEKYVTIDLAVTNDSTQFYVNPTQFDFQLLKSENKTAKGTIVVENPNNLTVELVSFPSFMTSCVYANGKVEFETKNADTMNIGLSSGNIILSAGEVFKSVFVRVNVIDHIINDFKNDPYYFALDKNRVEVTRVNPASVKVLMKLEMFFLGYGKMSNEIETYQLPYFKEKVLFYPGEEVNDFFIKQRATQDSNTSFDAYQFANVKMTFTEVDASDNVLDSFTLNEVRFVPGYTPKCFPYFTDFNMRRFFHNSKLAISMDMLGRNLLTIEFLRKLNEKVKVGPNIRTIIFNADRFGGENEIIDLKRMNFVPVKTTKKVVHIFFETHNLVFDWFSCAGDYELPSEFEHTISDNVKSGNEEKFDTKKIDTLSINTGWILNEEVELIDAIFESNFVLIQFPERTVRAIPQSKKNALGGSEIGFKSMMLEFKILKDER